MIPHRRKLGASFDGRRRSEFLVWAPKAERVEVHLLSPVERFVPMEGLENGYFGALVEDAEPGASYLYRLDGKTELPDPASRYQPEGVHGPSQITGPTFEWEDGNWCGIPFRDLVLYELHVGTFTEEGTFDAVAAHLDELADLGVNAIELMPVTQFPGGRNWGYDGVFPFAAQSSYGGPDGLKRLVDRCHRRGFAVVLDVVYNHVGPEGNVLGAFAPYFTDRYRTPWGPAVNFDGPWSDEVRRFFIDSALYWLDEHHIDALRLDAVHAITDSSPQPFLEELAVRVKEHFRRPRYLIPESAANDPRLVRSRDLGGYGLDAVWNDDFHHALRVLLTSEQTGYYQDYGGVGRLEKAFGQGFIYSGEYSRYRRRRHGSSSRDIPVDRFVVFSQNHDQVGNRMRGERLASLVCFERLKLAAAAVLLSPYLPLLFMGEEYGEKRPFPYFVSHSDPELIEAVRRGRREEFAAFDWAGEPPDPQNEETYRSGRLDRSATKEEAGRTLLTFYRELIHLRKQSACLARRSRDHMEAGSDETRDVMTLRYWTRDGSEGLLIVYHFSGQPVETSLSLPRGTWRKRLDSAEDRFRGPGSRNPWRLSGPQQVSIALPPWSVVVYESAELPSPRTSR